MNNTRLLWLLPVTLAVVLVIGCGGGGSSGGGGGTTTGTTTTGGSTGSTGSGGLASPTLATPTTLSGHISLSWTTSAGATAYRVYRGTSPGAETLLASSVTNSYVDAAASAGTNYVYEVTATQAASESGRSNEVSYVLTSFLVTDLGAAPGTPAHSWVNGTGLAVLGYSGSNAQLLDFKNGGLTSAFNASYSGVAVSDDGTVAACTSGGSYVWFKPNAYATPISVWGGTAVRHTLVGITNSDNVLYDHFDQNLGGGWHVYSTQTASDAYTMEDMDPVYLSDWGAIGTSATLKGPAVYRSGSEGAANIPAGSTAEGINNNGDLLAEDTVHQTTFIQGGPIGSRTINNFDVTAVAGGQRISDAGYVIGKSNGVWAIYDPATRSVLPAGAVGPYSVTGLLAINRNGQALAMGTLAGSLHFLRITPGDAGFLVVRKP